MLSRILPSKSRRFRALLVSVLLAAAMLTVSLAGAASSAYRDRATRLYAAETDKTTAAIEGSLNGYVSLLYSGRAFILNSQKVYPSEWAGFYNNQDVFNRFKGVSVLNYIQVVTPEQKAQFTAEMRKTAEFGSKFVILPEENRDIYGVATLSLSKAGTKPTGYNVFRTPERYAIYERAKQTGLPAVSALTDFSTGSKGFFVALPVVQQGEVGGYVNAVLYSEDLFSEVMEPRLVGSSSIKVTDVTTPKNPEVLYTSSDWTGAKLGLTRTRTLSFGGRQWKLEYHTTQLYALDTIPTAIVVGVLITGLLLVLVLVGSAYLLKLMLVGSKSNRSAK